MEESLSSSSSQQILLEQNPETEPETFTTKSPKKLALIPFVLLIYFEVSGGPYGEEATVGAVGPVLAILGFFIFPFIWSIPEALVTAELAAAFPGNGGFVIWANEGFGPFWGFLMGFWKFFSGVINLATSPVLCIDYLKLIIPSLSSGLFRYLAIFIFTSVLSFLNYTGLTIVGYTAVVLAIVSLMPFVLLTLISIPKIDPSRWLSLGQNGVKKDWTLYFNTLFWNLNFWDNASTLAGEVEQPQKAFPKALLSAGLLTCLAYIIPLMAVTGAIPLEQKDWVDGYFADAAEIIAGRWLKILMETGVVLSNVGQYEAQLSSAAYQVLGMADLGFIPQIFRRRSSWFNTPSVAILMSAVIALIVSYMSFNEILYIVNFLYGLGMLLEFASYLWLRRKFPLLKRPFSVPMKLPGLVIMCLIPSVFLIYVMTLSTTTVYVASAFITAFGIVLYHCLNLCKAKNWIEFNNVGEKMEEEEENDL